MHSEILVEKQIFKIQLKYQWKMFIKVIINTQKQVEICMLETVLQGCCICFQ